MKYVPIASLLLSACATLPIQLPPQEYEGRIKYKDPNFPIMEIETRIDKYNIIPSFYINKDLYENVEKDSCIMVTGSRILEHKILGKDTLMTYIDLKIDTAMHVPKKNMKHLNKNYVPQKQARRKIFQRIEPEPFFDDQ